MSRNFGSLCGAISHCALALGVLMATAAAAQTQGQGANGALARSGLEDIVVTAQRRSELLQDVPISVTALSSQSLKTQQINDLLSLQRIAPGLQMQAYPGDNQAATISMRGMFSTDALPSVDPAVGIYLDGVYIARSTGANMNLIDIDRVEVLRGPQGTLFGRNTIGGAISIIPKQPTERFEGSIEGAYGNYDAFRLQGVVNMPLSDNLDARVVAAHNERGPVARGPLTGVKLNVDNTDFTRGQILYRFNENWSMLVSGDYSHTHYKGNQWTTPVLIFGTSDNLIKTVSGGTDSGANYNDSDFTTRPLVTADGKFDSTIWGTAATLTGDVGDGVTFKSILAYRELERTITNGDTDGTPYHIVDQFLLQETNAQTSAEFQLLGTSFDDKLNWIVGAYYFNETGRFLSISQALFPFIQTQAVSDGRVENGSASIFGQAIYSFADQLRFTVGARWVRDTRDLDARNHSLVSATGAFASCALPTTVAPTCSALRSANFKYVPFTVGLDYKPGDETLLYAKFSRGYRAGGFNLRGTSTFQLTPFSPERLDSYEVGLKTELFDRRLRINADAYHARYTSIILGINRATPTGIASVISNAGTARINGVELEIAASIQNLLLSATGAYTDTKFLSLQPGTSVTLASPFGYTPKYTASLSADYKIPTDLGELNLHTDYNYKTRVNYGSVPPINPANSQGAYGLLNAVMTLNIESPDLSISVYGKNLTNTHYLSRTVDLGAIGTVTGFPGDPRTYGVSARYRF